MLKRLNIFTVALAILVVPSLLFAAADKFSPANATVNTDNTVTVPLTISNQDDLMAIDIPLKFSEGVSLKEVTFENTRVAHFDLKVANINNDEHTVVIGLVSQTSAVAVPNLSAGEGTVANLVFEVDDPSIDQFTLEAVTLDNPRHQLTYVYNRIEGREGVRHVRTNPDFSSYTVALSGIAGEGLPDEFALEQNYPNPFNPTTEIQFSLPVASRVNLTVFNLLGQQVKSVVNGNMEAGVHTVTWNGTNSSGNQVSSGIYFYRIEAGDFNLTRKMMLLK